MAPACSPGLEWADDWGLSVAAAAPLSVLLPETDGEVVGMEIVLLVDRCVSLEDVALKTFDVALGISDTAVMNVAGVVVMPSDSVNTSALRAQQSAP